MRNASVKPQCAAFFGPGGARGLRCIKLWPSDAARARGPADRRPLCAGRTTEPACGCSRDAGQMIDVHQARGRRAAEDGRRPSRARLREEQSTGPGDAAHEQPFASRARQRSRESDRGPSASRWPARLDWLQSVSGLVLALFMWGHMFFVSSILLGKDAMWTVTRFFEGYFFFGRSLPWLVSLVVAGDLRAVRAARAAGAAQVPDQLAPVPRVPRHMPHACSTGTPRCGGGRC